jgi:hypothetical protein
MSIINSDPFYVYETKFANTDLQEVAAFYSGSQVRFVRKQQQIGYE